MKELSSNLQSSIPPTNKQQTKDPEEKARDFLHGSVINDDTINNLLAAELNEMTMDERNQVLQDIHGVADLPKETPEFLNQSLLQLEMEIIQLIVKNPETAKPYKLAETLDSGYVHSQEFLIKFLRCEDYNVQLAAQRVLKYFQQKSLLFPDNDKILVKEVIHLNDIGESIQALDTGYCQILPCRDQGGRAVIFIVPQTQKARSIPNMSQNLLRVAWYMLMIAAQDVVNQKLGVVNVIYSIGLNFTVDPNYFRGNFTSLGETHLARMGKMRQSIPLKSAGFHHCCDFPIMKFLSPIAMFAMGQQARVRFRTHYGSHRECQLALRRYGIPTSILPLKKDGSVSLSWLTEWKNQRLRLEQQPGNVQDNSDNNDPQLIVVPGYHDVLFGRGKMILSHPGNVRFHQMVDLNRDKYDQETKAGKTNVVEQIIYMIHLSGGRFLKKQDHTEATSNNESNPLWIQVDNATARDKVSQAFRTKRASVHHNRKAKGSVVDNEGVASIDLHTKENFLEYMPTNGQEGKRMKLTTMTQR